jgi:hypothetical protein
MPGSHFHPVGCASVFGRQAATKAGKSLPRHLRQGPNSEFNSEYHR